MNDIKTTIGADGRGFFEIEEKDQRIAEMAISVSGNELTVYHTEVSPAAEGKGLAKLLLESMADYARKNELKVIPLCTFVAAQFKRHPDDFKDIWKKGIAGDKPVRE